MLKKDGESGAAPVYDNQKIKPSLLLILYPLHYSNSIRRFLCLFSHKVQYFAVYSYTSLRTGGPLPWQFVIDHLLQPARIHLISPSGSNNPPGLQLSR